MEPVREDEAVESILTEETITLTVPASLEFIRIVRLTASGVASRLGFDIEDIEDLRVAVDELASIVVENALPADLQVVFTVRDGVLRIEGRAPARPNGDPKVEELTRQILAAVVDEYRVVVENGVACFACSRRLPQTA